MERNTARKRETPRVRILEGPSPVVKLTKSTPVRDRGRSLVKERPSERRWRYCHRGKIERKVGPKVKPVAEIGSPGRARSLPIVR